MDLEAFRLPNGLIGVKFKRTWNAYKSGSLAAFADKQALDLQRDGLVELRGLGEERRPAAHMPLRTEAPAVAAATTSVTADAERPMDAERPPPAVRRDTGAHPAIEIPEDWENQHHTKIMALARELGVEVTTKAEAEAVIREELERRGAA